MVTNKKLYPKIIIIVPHATRSRIIRIVQRRTILKTNTSRSGTIRVHVCTRTEDLPRAGSNASRDIHVRTTLKRPIDRIRLRTRKALYPRCLHIRIIDIHHLEIIGIAGRKRYRNSDTRRRRGRALRTIYDRRYTIYITPPRRNRSIHNVRHLIRRRARTRTRNTNRSTRRNIRKCITTGVSTLDLKRRSFRRIIIRRIRKIPRKHHRAPRKSRRSTRRSRWRRVISRSRNIKTNISISSSTIPPNTRRSRPRILKNCSTNTSNTKIRREMIRISRKINISPNRTSHTTDHKITSRVRRTTRRIRSNRRKRNIRRI